MHLYAVDPSQEEVWGVQDPLAKDGGEVGVAGEGERGEGQGGEAVQREVPHGQLNLGAGREGAGEGAGARAGVGAGAGEGARPGGGE